MSFSQECGRTLGPLGRHRKTQRFFRGAGRPCPRR